MAAGCGKREEPARLTASNSRGKISSRISAPSEPVARSATHFKGSWPPYLVALANAQHFSQPDRQHGRGLQLDATRLPLAQVIIDRDTGAAGPAV